MKELHVGDLATTCKFRGQKLRVGRSLIPGKTVRAGLLIGGEGDSGGVERKELPRNSRDS